uniref:Uncharacterized protein n=1 Tax=Rhizophora mucronata TaxID=61149 RepID=A0A2P2PSK6_RHIMU
MGKETGKQGCMAKVPSFYNTWFMCIIRFLYSPNYLVFLAFHPNNYSPQELLLHLE